MTPRRRSVVLAAVAVAVTVLGALVVVDTQLPAAGANGLLRPARRRVVRSPPPTCQDGAFAGEGVTLKGWQCRASTPRRGALVYLHGIADNRTSGAGIVQRFGERGFDV